jgi:hypothetical protein
MKRRMLIVMVVFVSLLRVQAQISQPPISSLSPNAAELGKYGTVPVSFFTGIPNVNIPLYNEKLSDYDLNISLNYHSGGVQPDQRAGWLGVGWSLSGGGVISRKVNDIIDEYSNPSFSPYANNLGFYFNHNVLNTSSWNQRNYLRGIAQQSILKDNSPDEFSFMFDEYSGKFYLDHTGKWIVQCNKPVKVEFDGLFLSIPFQKQGRYGSSGYSKSFSGFTITTDKGTKYIFGGNTSTIEYSINFFGQNNSEWIANSWYLRKIIQPSGKEINFYYQRGSYICQMSININNDLGTYTENSGGVFALLPECESWNYTALYYQYSGLLISPIYLSSITTPVSTINLYKSISRELTYKQEIFDWEYSKWYQGNKSYKFLPYLQPNNENYPQCLSNLNWYKLDSIVSKDKYNNIRYKKIAFEYNINSYYTISERLFLKKIMDDDKIYNFDYDNINKLPDYLSNKVDHWGFFNNTYAYLEYDNYYNYRNPDSNCLTYGILSKIRYPTGGYTEFVFEPHYYRKQLSLNRWESCNDLGKNNLAGGLRIKQIKNSPTSTGPAQIVKEYYYVSDYLQNKQNSQISSGALGGQVKYYFNDYIVSAFNDNNVRKKICTFSSNSVLPSCNNGLGIHIGYSQVVEKENDGSFSIYSFSNFDNGRMDESADAIIQYTHTPYEAYASKSQERGLLLSSEKYNSNSIKIKSNEFIYERDSNTNNYVRAMFARWRNICSGSATCYDEGVAYKIYTYLMRIKTETEKLFDSETGVQLQSSNKIYTYNSQKLIASISTTNSDNRTIKTETKYPADYPYFNYYWGNPNPVENMKSANKLNYPIEQKTFINGKLTKLELIVYSDDRKNTGYGNSIIKPYETYSLNTDKPVDDFNSISSGDGNTPHTISTRMTKNFSYTYYPNGNLKEVINEKTGVTTTYVWGYNGLYLMAEVVGVNYNQLVGPFIQGNSLFITEMLYSPYPSESDLTKLGRIKTYFSSAQVTTYTYKPLVGMTSQTDPRGVTTYYEYDTFNRLKRTYIKENGVEKTIQTYDYHYKQ